MHRHNRFRHGPRPFRGFFWLIILVMFFFGGRWWPGILVLIGLSIVFGSLFREERSPAEPQNPPPPYIPVTPPAPPRPAPTPTPVEQIHRSDLLPVTCPQCGGPIRSYEVKWTGKQSAACPYCGSNLPMKKG
jgi:hypothetical protein